MISVACITISVKKLVQILIYVLFCKKRNEKSISEAGDRGRVCVPRISELCAPFWVPLMFFLCSK